jgi:hypothetical protein
LDIRSYYLKTIVVETGVTTEGSLPGALPPGRMGPHPDGPLWGSASQYAAVLDLHNQAKFTRSASDGFSDNRGP